MAGKVISCEGGVMSVKTEGWTEGWIAKIAMGMDGEKEVF
jgi:hypothetical protein